VTVALGLRVETEVLLQVKEHEWLDRSRETTKGIRQTYEELPCVGGHVLLFHR
jgi:hypothetical protein